MAIGHKLIDKLLADYKKPEDIIGEEGLLKQLTKALLERAMQAELTEHLGYEKHDPVGHNSGNSRNGATTKTLKGDFGEVPLETPRDRNGSYEPKIVGKNQTRFTGFDDKIISMYARGMSTREIEGHLEEIYKVEVSPTLISNVTDAVMEEVKNWQSRPLDSVYPIVYLDALVVKIRETGHVRNRAIYVVIGVNLQGKKEVLGAVGGSGRRSQVLAAGANGVEEPRRGRYVHRLRGWAEGISRIDCDGVSGGAGAVVHCAPGTSNAELCMVETAQGGGCGFTTDLPCQHDRRGRTTAR
jgi:Transposase, Mutator family